jgi:2-C-methyl-D-erythritol 4-phosphate cytidylyltransferase/2-C-methyl-D-erythritol 2,4-cyclodiphosphate synthase
MYGARELRGLPESTPDERLRKLRRAEELLAGASLPRVGFGTDTHGFDASAELWVAGLYWPGEPGLAGHSDGDVVAHAIVDALLSAAGLGDIGTIFGTGDPRLAGAHGSVFLEETRRLVEDGRRLREIRLQLIEERRRFAAQHRERSSGEHNARGL